MFVLNARKLMLLESVQIIYTVFVCALLESIDSDFFLLKVLSSGVKIN